MARYRQGWSKGWRKSTRGAAGEWFDSYWEVQYMDELDRDPIVLKWTRHHGLQIPYRKWWGGQGRYEPDFLVEIAGGDKEIREVKGEHLFRDANTVRKLKAGETYCRQRGMKFRVVTKSFVDPELWTPCGNVKIEALSPSSPAPQPLHSPEPSGRFGVVAAEDAPTTARPRFDLKDRQAKPAGCLSVMVVTAFLVGIAAWLLLH